MRKYRRKQIEHVRWRVKNPKRPAWLKGASEMFAKIWEKADKMYTTPKPTYIVDPSTFEKFKSIAAGGILDPPKGSMFAGVDIAENDMLDESTIVYANRKSDGTLEIVGVQKL